MNLHEFLRRLEEGDYPHYISRTPWSDSVRVHAIGATEIWIVDFFEDGSIESERYRLVTTDAGWSAQPTLIEEFFGRLGRAWREAAADLSFRFTSPFEIVAPNGSRCSCTGYIPDFGGQSGTVILSREDPEGASRLAEELGYYTPALNPRHYEFYQREHVIETLSDWGWHGEGQPPAWLIR